MSITIGATTLSTLKAQPFGYDETETSRGQTAKKFAISGLCTPDEWLDLLDVYDTWRDIRIDEEDPLISGVVGTTISFSGTGPGGQTWTSVACWFTSAPNAIQNGAFLDVEFELVNAAQALEVLLKGQEDQTTTQELTPDYGTITIGTTTLTLTKPVDSYGQGPQLELTATGKHYISGPLVVYKIKDVEGTTNLVGWNAIRAWYEQQIVAVPLSGSYFPITAPTATAERKIVSGSPTDVYTVSIQLGLVI